MNNRLINTKVAAAGGCTDIVDSYDPFGGGGLALYQLNGDATDVSTNYDGAASNVTYGTGVFGQAGVFNGSSSNVDTGGDLVNSLTAITVSGWFYTEPNTNYSYALQFGTIGSAGEAISISRWRSVATGGIGAYTLYANDGTSTIDGNFTLNEDTWYHIAITWTGTTVKFYVNGNLETTATASASLSIPASGNSGYIGRYIANQSFNWKGSIDQVRIFNTALTPLEVEALYTEELCICDGTVDTLQVLGDTSCIATYQLDGNANDLSGNYSGTPTDVSYGVGEFDLAGVFNGSSSYIQTSLSPSLATISHSLWFYADSADSTNSLYYFDNRGGRIDIYITGTGSNSVSHSFSNVNITATTATSQWNHLLLVYTGWASSYSAGSYGSAITVTAYLNGSSIGTASPTPYGQTTGMRIGRSGGSYYFEGRIDQFRVFNKALDQNDVDILFAETACTYGGRQSGDLQILGDSSCVAYYKLDGNADDVSGNYNGTFANANYTNGEFLYAGVFNGTNAYVTQSNSLSLTNRTFSAWVKFDSFEKFILGTDPHYLPQNSYGSWDILPTAAGISFVADKSDGSTYSLIQIPNNLSLGVWYHIVFTAAPNDLKAYIDGQLQTPNLDLSRSIATIDLANVNIGRTRSTSGNSSTYRFYFDGEIDQVRIFNKAINQSEVNTLYNEGI